MNEEKLQLILDYLDKIAVKLGIGVQQVWPWFIKQQYVDAFISLGFLLLSIIIAAAFFTITVKLWREDDKYNKNQYGYIDEEKVEKEKRYAYSIYHRSHEFGWIWINICFIALVLFSSSIFYCQFFDIFNPEYSAFKDIVSMLPSSTK